MCRSEPHTLARVMRTSAAPGSGCGTGYSRKTSGLPASANTTARPTLIASLLVGSADDVDKPADQVTCRGRHVAAEQHDLRAHRGHVELGALADETGEHELQDRVAENPGREADGVEERVGDEGEESDAPEPVGA